jgi:hypothetical protein
MQLIPDELRTRLPPLFAQEAEDEPYVYARLFLPGTSLSWYVLEGETTEASGFVMGCFFTGQEEASFGHFPESFLDGFRGPNDETVQLDPNFTEGKLTDVVPAPDM